MITKIKKRDGRIVEFDQAKITEAIIKAAKASGGESREVCEELSKRVLNDMELRFGAGMVPGVEDVQDLVEKVLMETGHSITAKAYILYREKRKELREAKAVLIGVRDEFKLSLNAMKVLERRYLRKNEKGEVVETPAEMFRRVAKNIAQADKNYDANADIGKTEEEFYRMMTAFEFMPNSPTLMNAGTELQQLAACFVLPVEDTMAGIFDAVKNAALIHQTGGGTGFSFSRLRPKNDVVKSTGGIASGPVSFMRVFDVATDVIKQGGRRRGANMGILRVDHPDIIEFITAKEHEGILSNFNISVGVTEDFMRRVHNNEEYPLTNPRDNRVVQYLRARDVFNLIVTMAWHTGDPGLVFLDRLNRDNPTPKLGEIEATNPCGEQPLLPYEACNLGSINLAKMLNNGSVDFERLAETVKKAIHFLDNVIDMSKYPLPEIETMVRGNRKIGLGVMGFADMLIKLEIPYNSQEALDLGEKIMAFIAEESHRASEELAKTRGPFPNFGKSGLAKPRRNATVNTIAPAGTISIIANCSSGIEPIFAVVFVRSVMEHTELFEVNPIFEEVARRRKFYSDTLLKEIARLGSIQRFIGIPDDVKRIFVTALDISPEWHVRMQAAFQKYVDNAVSKTVNLPQYATPADVEKVYWLAYELGCKGVTVFRQGSRQGQVLNIGTSGSGSSGAMDKSYLTFSSEFTGCPTCMA